jgi:hypothetical protein
VAFTGAAFARDEGVALRPVTAVTVVSVGTTRAARPLGAAVESVVDAVGTADAAVAAVRDFGSFDTLIAFGCSTGAAGAAATTGFTLRAVAFAGAALRVVVVVATTVTGAAAWAATRSGLREQSSWMRPRRRPFRPTACVAAVRSASSAKARMASAMRGATRSAYHRAFSAW